MSSSQNLEEELIDQNLEEELISSIIDQDIDEVKALLEDGADIHFQKDQPLVEAAEIGDLEIIELLIANGANINAQNGAPLTASVDGGFLNNVKYLIDKGADLKLNNFNDVYLAGERGHLDILTYFLEEERSVESYDEHIQLLQDILIESIRNNFMEIMKYMVEKQHVDIHAQDDEAMYMALKTFDVDAVNYLINQADMQDVPYAIDNLIRLRSLVEDGLDIDSIRMLKRMFPWGETERQENDDANDYPDDFEDEDPFPWQYARSSDNRLSDELSTLNSDDLSDNETPVADNRLSDSDYEEDEHIDKGYDYMSDNEDIDKPIILNKGDDEKDKIKSICINETSPITLEEYDELNDLYTIYIRNTKGDFFDKGDCNTRSELRDYLNSDIDQEAPSFFMAIGTTPRLQRDLMTGFTSKPTGKIVVRLPNNIYVTLNSVKRILESKGHTKWFALPLYNGKRRRIVNLKGHYGISLNHGQIPGFIVYKLFTGSEIKQKVTVKESTSDYPSFYLHDMMEPLFVILDKYATPINRFINSVIKNVTKKDQ